MHQYFKCGIVSIRVPRTINLVIDRQQDSAEERSKGNGVGTLINRNAEGFQVVAAGTRRTDGSYRDIFALSPERSRSRRKPEQHGAHRWGDRATQHTFRCSHRHGHANPNQKRAPTKHNHRVAYYTKIDTRNFCRTSRRRNDRRHIRVKNPQSKRFRHPKRNYHYHLKYKNQITTQTTTIPPKTSILSCTSLLSIILIVEVLRLRVEAMSTIR